MIEVQQFKGLWEKVIGRQREACKRNKGDADEVVLAGGEEYDCRLGK